MEKKIGERENNHENSGHLGANCTRALSFVKLYSLLISDISLKHSSKMGRITISPIWDHYDKVVADPSFAICKKCKLQISRGNKDPKKMNNTNMLNTKQ